MRQLTVATWNVNSVNARASRLAQFLDKSRPDVLCLQETKCTDDKFPFALVEEHGYQAVVFGQKTYNGVAILSHLAIEDVERGLSSTDEDARLIAATVAGCRIISAYVPNGQAVGSEKFDYKLKWLKKLRAYLDEKHQKAEPLVLAGDFNVALEDRDVKEPEVWRGQVLFSEPEQTTLREVVDFGLVDTFRQFHEDAGHYSWWDYRQLAFPRNRGLRIDYVFATPTLASRCTQAWIARDERKGEKPSDHAPCLASFEGSF